MNLKLRHLEAFHTIVETGSVSEASIVLGLTQSSVSKLLAGFEAELGFLLFERIGRRLRLSEQGSMFLERTANAMELLEDIQTTAEDIRDNQGRRMRICAIGPLAFGGLISRSLSRFDKKFPNFTYTIDQKPRVEIEDWIIGGHTDLGLTLLPAMRENMRSRVFASTKAYALVPKGHQLAERRSISPADFVDHRVVLPKRSIRFRVLIEADFVQACVPLRPAFETSNAISTAHLVAENMAVSVVDPFTLMMIPDDRVCVLPWQPRTDISYGFIWPATRELAASEEELFSIIEEVAIEIIAAAEAKLHSL